MTAGDWLRLAVLLLGPLLTGTIAGYVLAGLLDLREVRALGRESPAGLSLDAVPWHLRQHFAPAIRGDRLPG